jgi:predicted dehydrogenase
MNSRAIPVSRRRFLQLSATGATAAAIGFPTIIPSRVLGSQAPSKLIRIAQIGCGRIARDMDLPGLLKHPNLARVVAVCDLDSVRRADAKQLLEERYAKALGQKVTVDTVANYAELLARPDIDAVSISTPDHWHAQPILEAALAGKDIYVQKPLSMTIAEGRLISDVVRAKGRILQIGSQQRSTEQFHRACQLVRNGRIGQVRTVRIGLPTDPAGGNKATMPVPSNLNYDTWLGSTPLEPYTEDRVHPQSADLKVRYGRPGWLRLNAYGCGMITGWGSHHVDIAHWGMGTELTGPVALKGTATWPGPDSLWDVHGKYSIELQYPNGATMFISDELPNGIRFEGTDGWIWVSRGSYTATASDPTSGKRATKALDASNPEWLRTSLANDKLQLRQAPKWDHHLDWLEAVRARREAVTNAETGHRSCSVCLMSWIAMRLGRPLKWDPEKERFDDAEANRMLYRTERAPHGAFAAAKRAGFTAFKRI